MSWCPSSRAHWLGFRPRLLRMRRRSAAPARHITHDTQYNARTYWLPILQTSAQRIAVCRPRVRASLCVPLRHCCRWNRRHRQPCQHGNHIHVSHEQRMRTPPSVAHSCPKAAPPSLALAHAAHWHRTQAHRRSVQPGAAGPHPGWRPARPAGWRRRWAGPARRPGAAPWSRRTSSCWSPAPGRRRSASPATPPPGSAPAPGQPGAVQVTLSTTGATGAHEARSDQQGC